MKLNERQAIGKLGLEVTRMGFGGAPFGNLFNPISEEDVADCLEAAYGAGVRYFDTAPLYGFGLSESRYGAHLARRRDEIVLSTKVGYSLVPRESGDPEDGFFVDHPPLKSVFDYSAEAVKRSLGESLERLRTDRIDIVFIHDPDEGISLQPDFDPYAVSHFREAMEETYPVLDELRSQGVIRAVGAGMNQWQVLADFARAGDFDCFLLAGRYTLLEQTSLEGLLSLCVEKGVRIVIGGPYNSGVLATGVVEGAYYNYAPPRSTSSASSPASRRSANGTGCGCPPRPCSSRWRTRPSPASSPAGAPAPKPRPTPPCSRRRSRQRSGPSCRSRDWWTRPRRCPPERRPGRPGKKPLPLAAEVVSRSGEAAAPIRRRTRREKPNRAPRGRPGGSECRRSGRGPGGKHGITFRRGRRIGPSAAAAPKPRYLPPTLPEPDITAPPTHESRHDRRSPEEP